MPFEAGTTVVELGDNITDDLQSWFEILRNLVEERRPQDEIRFVNAGISGNTTSQAISRFLGDVRTIAAALVERLAEERGR